MVKLGYLILYVEDVPRSVQFYKEAFGIETKMITPEKDYAELQTGETTLAMVDKKYIQSQLPEIIFPKETTVHRSEITLVSNDIHQDLDNAISAGAKLIKAVASKPWGQQLGYLQDIDGNLIELCTPIIK